MPSIITHAGIAASHFIIVLFIAAFFFKVILLTQTPRFVNKKA